MPEEPLFKLQRRLVRKTLNSPHASTEMGLRVEQSGTYYHAGDEQEIQKSFLDLMFSGARQQQDDALLADLMSS